MGVEVVALTDGTMLSILRIGDAARKLSALERELVASYTPAKTKEFAAGRQAAHTALRHLGIRTTAIGRGAAGEPQFPQGTVGSISHTRTYAVAAVATAGGCASLGVDLDDGSTFEFAAEQGFTWETEVREVQAALGMCRPSAVRFAFSAKEAIFKCQYWLPGGSEALTALQVRLRPAKANAKRLCPQGWRANEAARRMLSTIEVEPVATTAGTVALARCVATGV